MAARRKPNTSAAERERRGERERELAVEKRRQELVNDPSYEAQHELRTIEAQELQLQEVREKDPSRRRQLREQREKIERDILTMKERYVAELQAAAEEKVRLERILKMEEKINAVPWIRSVRGEDRTDLRPNACATCANSPARFASLEQSWKSSQPGDPQAIREEIFAKYPKYARRDLPMQVHRIKSEELAKVCGNDRAGACADPSTGDVYLTASSSSALVMHEVFHNLAAPEWHKRAPDTVEEAVTEYLTRRQGLFPSEDKVLDAKAYEGSQRLISEYIAAKPAREDALAKAYLTGDFSDLERLEDSPVRRPYGPRFMASPNPVDVRFKTWDALLKNRLPGSSVTTDDEAILAAKRPAAPTFPEDRHVGY